MPHDAIDKVEVDDGEVRARRLLDRILNQIGITRPNLANRIGASATLMYKWVVKGEKIQEKWWGKLEEVVNEWEEFNGIRPTEVFSIDGIKVGGRVRQKVGTRWLGTVKVVDVKHKMVLVGIDGATSEWVESRFLRVVDVTEEVSVGGVPAHREPIQK